MIQPDELKSDAPLVWSPGRGTDILALFCACIRGDLPGVTQLIDRDASLTRCQYAYRTPLYFAVRENRLAVAEFLLARGADPLSLAVNDSLLDICQDRGYAAMEQLLQTNYRETQGASPAGEPVAAAIRAHDLALMRKLLDDSPELLHVGDMRSNEPIHWATMTRQLVFIDELLDRGADINAVRFDGARPIQLTNGDYYFRGWRDVPKDWSVSPAEVLAHLQRRGAYTDICTACHTGDFDRVRELLDADRNLANQNAAYVSYYIGSGTPLKNAAARGHMAIVKLLLDRGADPNLREEGIAPRGHALYSAVANRHYEVVKLFLEHGADPNPPVESSADALSRALMNDDRPMIELLCSHGAARSMELLASDNDLRTAAAALAANPALADDPRALASAASNGHEGFVRLLLRYERDLPRRVDFPAWAVGGETREINELLFAHGMSPSQPDWLMITPLHQFARTGDVEKATWFIERGANLHARDEDICSMPLGWAAKFNQKPMAELLLKAGAQTNLPDDPPWATPLAWATRRGSSGVADLLRQHGAH